MADTVSDLLSATANAPAEKPSAPSPVTQFLNTSVPSVGAVPVHNENTVSSLLGIVPAQSKMGPNAPSANPVIDNRTTSEFVSDSLLSAASSGVNATGGLVGLFADNMVNDKISHMVSNTIDHLINGTFDIKDISTTNFDSKVAPAIFKGTKYIADSLQGFMSDKSKQNSLLVQQQNATDSLQNQAEHDSAIASGGSKFIEDAKLLGKNFLDTGSNIINNPVELTNEIAGALGSLGPSAKVVGGIEKLVVESGLYKSAQLARAIDPSMMAKIVGATADTVKTGITAGAVGITEAAGTYQQTLQSVLDTPDGDLMNTSVEFRDLVKNGMPIADAKQQVATNTASESFWKQLPMAAATSVLALKFDAHPLGIFKDGMKHGLAGVGKEVLGQTVEESLQSASGQYAQNQANQDHVNPTQSLLDQVGEQGAQGAIGGFGMAGAIAIPGLATHYGHEAAHNLFHSVVPTGPVAPEVLSDSTVAQNNIEAANQSTRNASNAVNSAVSSGINAVKDNAGLLARQAGAAVVSKAKDAYEAAKPTLRAAAVASAPLLNEVAPLVQDLKDKAAAGLAKARTVAGPYIEAGLNKANDVANRVSTKINEEIHGAATSSEDLTRAWVDNTTEQNLPQGVKDITAPAASDTPKDLSGIVQPNTDVLSTVNNIVRGLSDSKIKARELSDSAVLYVQDHVEKLRAALPTLPADIKEQVQKVLNSPQLAHVIAKLQNIDMSKTVGAAVADVKRMARLNPGNVNPVEIDRILKQESANLSAQDVMFLKASRDISQALDNHANRQFQIDNSTGPVDLSISKPGEDPKGLNNNQTVSRSVQVDGFSSSEDGEHFPSIGELASNVVKGGQNSDNAYVNDKGVKVSSKRQAKLLTNLTQHLINKVGALNQSFDQAKLNSQGKLTSDAVGFEYLSQKTRKMTSAKTSKGVTYHPNSEGSDKNAQAIWNDAKAAVDVHNTLVDLLPEHFPQGKLTLPDLRTAQVTEQVPEKVSDEINNIATVMGLLGLNVPSADAVTSVPTTKELRKILDHVLEVVKDMQGDPGFLKSHIGSLQKELSWVVKTKEDAARKDRAQKSADKHGKGNPKANLMVQLAEELNETMKELAVLNGEDTSALDLEKLKLKVLRFGAYTVIKDLNSPYNGLTNAQALAKAEAPVQPEAKPKVETEAKAVKPKEKTVPQNNVVPDYSKVPQRILMLAREGVVSDNELTPSERKTLKEADVFPGEDGFYDDNALGHEAQNRIRNKTWDPKINLFAQEETPPPAPKTEPGKPAGVKLQFNDLLPAGVKTKDQAKANKATKFIGRGSKNSSTTLYAKSFGPLANTGKYSSEDVVFISAEGKRNGRVDPNYTEIQLAMDSGATLITDIPKDRVRPFNEGERQVTAYLESHDYVEKTPGTWVPVKAATDAQAAAEAITKTKNPTTATEVVSPIGETTEVKITQSRENLPAVFHSTFSQKPTEADFTNGRELLELVQKENPESAGFVNFVQEHARAIYGRMNERLQTVGYGTTDTTPILDKLRESEDITKITRFKALMFVNKVTGKYDPAILSLAVAHVMDYLSAAVPAAPSLLNKRLEEDEISMDSLTQQQLEDYMSSVSVRQAAEGLARSLPDLLHLEVNQDAPEGDIRSALEDLIKEAFTAISEVTDLIKIRPVPTKRGIPTPAVIITDALREDQRAIGLNGKGAISQLRTGERTGPSLGKPPESVAQTQSRGGVKLSTTEKEVEKNMQSIPHLLAPVFHLVNALGFDAMFQMLGGQMTGNLHEDHPLRKSIEGKNLSITRDFQDAMDISNTIVDASEDQKTPVFYPVGITKVGRHQMKGPNPQNNKILRALVTPTHSVLDMTTTDHQNAFWLTVAQASGLAKPEKGDHAKIYAETESKFRTKYSEAIKLATEFQRTGEIDAQAFTKAMGTDVKMTQINAVFAVASLDYAKTKNHPDALTKFETSLSFELDGLTDGPGNMMLNFGQGPLTPQDHENMKRVGLFLGSKGQTTNMYYAHPDAKDLYMVTSQNGEFAMFTIRKKSPAQVGAIMRFASRFGDLETVTEEDGSVSYKMTRDTAKSPTTKKVYGSAAKGIAVGMANDMLSEFYRKMVEVVKDGDPAQVLAYPEFHKDFEILFGGKFPKVNWSNSWISKTHPKGETSGATTEFFTGVVKNTLAKALSEAAQNTMGRPITMVNDSLVFVTNVQAEFLKLVYAQRLQKLIDSTPDAKSIKDLSRRQLRTLQKEVMKLAPSYFNGVQTLSIGSFEGNISNTVEFSSNFEGRMRMKSSVAEPGDAGVKVIPYVTQGRGDAMMMNNIYAGENFPKNTVFVFDGVEMKISDIQEYSKVINEAVAKNWSADVLGDIATDFQKFMANILTDERALLEAAFNKAYENRTNSSPIPIAEAKDMLPAIQNFAARNRARKEAFAKVPRSINHMAGANVSLDLGPDGNLSLDEINQKISDHLENPKDAEVIERETPEAKPVKPETQFSELRVSNGLTMLQALAGTKMNARLKAVVQTLRAAMPDVRIVMGSPDQILEHRKAEGVTAVANSVRAEGFYDPSNQTIYLNSITPETLVHELIHFATFALVQNVYDDTGTEAQTNAVQRLEGLMGEFLGLDFSKAAPAAQEAARKAQAEIIKAQVGKDSFNKAKALNEFMAWSLANDPLSRELNNTVTGSVTQMIKKVRALMARILGFVGHDVFTNVLFNTKAILGQSFDEQASSDEVPPEDGGNDFGGNSNDGGNGGNGDNGTEGPGPQSPSEIQTNFWIKLLAKMLDEKTKEGNPKIRIKDSNQYVNNASKAFTGLSFGGFIFSATQEATFRAIHMVLAFEMNLDANSLVGMNQVFAYMTEHLTPAMFFVDGQVKYQALFDALGNTKNKEGVSDAIATFFALSQTNSEFRAALDLMPTPENTNGVKTSSFNDLVLSLSNILMRKAVGSAQVEGVTATVALDAMAKSIIDQDVNKEFTVLRTIMNTFDAADKYMSGGLRKIAEFGENLNRQVPDEQKLLKVITQSIQLATSFAEERRATETYAAVKHLTHMGADLSWAIPLREFVTEMIGIDAANANLVAMLDVTKVHVDALRQNYREKLPVILQGAFQNKPSAEQWKASHSVMGQTDFAAVFNLSKSDVSFKVFSDTAYRSRQIQNLEQTIKRQVSAGVANEILEKAQQLAGQMNGHGDGHQLLPNAFAINHFVGDQSKPHLVEVIDKLVTYYAIDLKPAEQLQMVSDMYAADPEAMKNLAVYMQGLNAEEELKLQTPPEVPDHQKDHNGNPLYGDPVMKMKLNGLKGYIPNFGMPDVQMSIEDDVNQNELEKRGWRRVADYKGEDGLTIISHGVYVTNVKQSGGYAQGVMQSIQNTYRGVNSGTGLTVNGTTSGVIKGIDTIDQITETLNNAGAVADPKEVLRPVWDESGVAFYQRVINPDLIQRYMAPPQNLALMLGVWAGRQVEEKAAQVYNNMLIDELRNIYDNRKANEQDLFIDLRAEARKMRLYNSYSKAKQKTVVRSDPIYADAFEKIPPQTKYYIGEVFPEGFWVRKDQINLAVGYAEPSIVDFWTGKTRLSQSTQDVMRAVAELTLGKLKDGTSAMTLLQKSEQGVQSTVAAAKDLIVVRSLIVPYFNSQANVYNLVLRGVPVKQIIKGYGDKLVEVEQYNQNASKKILLETQIQLARGDENRIQILKNQMQVLEDQNRRMSIWPLLEAGAYKTISEGLTDADFELLKGGLTDMLDKQIDKLPGVVQTIVKNGLVSKETAIYELASKAVHYGDFLAKGVYYDHLISRGMDKKTALEKINEEFVNFAIPPGRLRTGLDKMGATWFGTYKIRAAKIALAQARNNPFRSLLINMDPGADTALHSNIVSAISNGSISYGTGWGMLFNSPSLNPWMNLMGW